MSLGILESLDGGVNGMMYNRTRAGAGANPVRNDRLWGAAPTLILVIDTIAVGGPIANVHRTKKA